MATVATRLNNWALEELRWSSQVNQSVLVAWYNKGLQIFQKAILEYVSGMQNTSVSYADIQKDVDEYSLPEFDNVYNIEDFYSIVQLRIAYHTGKHDTPIYRVCKPINMSDYNIRPNANIYDDDANLKVQWWQQVWKPFVWNRISELNPRYVFVPKKVGWAYKNYIKIFPTPTEDVENGFTLTYNFIQQPVSANTNENSLNLPRYFFDAIEDYLTFRLYQAENPEMAQWYYQQFEQTLHDNIYGLNKDKRPIEEDFANTSYFSHY